MDLGSFPQNPKSLFFRGCPPLPRSVARGVKDGAGNGDEAAEQRTAGGAFLLEPHGERDDDQRGQGDDRKDNAGATGGEGPLETSDAEGGAGDGIDEDPRGGFSQVRRS